MSPTLITLSRSSFSFLTRLSSRTFHSSKANSCSCKKARNHGTCDQLARCHGVLSSNKIGHKAWAIGNLCLDPTLHRGMLHQRMTVKLRHKRTTRKRRVIKGGGGSRRGYDTVRYLHSKGRAMVWFVIPRRGRRRRRGRRLRFRCHQGGFLSSPLLVEPLAPLAVWFLVFGFPADKSAKASPKRLAR